MKPGLKPYDCRYISNGISYTCRIDAASPHHAAAIMDGLPWGKGCGPIGSPRRCHPRLNRVMAYAVSCWTGASKALPHLAAATHRLTPLIR